MSEFDVDLWQANIVDDVIVLMRKEHFVEVNREFVAWLVDRLVKMDEEEPDRDPEDIDVPLQDVVTAEFVTGVIAESMREDTERQLVDHIPSPEPEYGDGNVLTGYGITADDVELLIDRYLHRADHRRTDSSDVDEQAWKTSREVLDELTSELTEPALVTIAIDWADTTQLCDLHHYPAEPVWFIGPDESDVPGAMFALNFHYDEDGTNLHSVLGPATEGTLLDRVIVAACLYGGMIAVSEMASNRNHLWLIHEQKVSLGYGFAKGSHLKMIRDADPE